MGGLGGNLNTENTHCSEKTAKVQCVLCGGLSMQVVYSPWLFALAVARAKTCKLLDLFHLIYAFFFFCFLCFTIFLRSSHAHIVALLLMFWP